MLGTPGISPTSTSTTPLSIQTIPTVLMAKVVITFDISQTPAQENPLDDVLREGMCNSQSFRIGALVLFRFVLVRLLPAHFPRKQDNQPYSLKNCSKLYLRK